MEPCGNANPRAVIARAGLLLKGISPVGAEAKLCMLYVEDEGINYELKAFYKTDMIKQYIEEKYGKKVLSDLLRKSSDGVRISVIYKPDVNEYNGKTSLQLVLEDYK